ncbi:hypothetical protein O1611_g9698 [Lasiodiplodia mahajangana]|uniref:Uncharacterized protein n=1 Tax=Lasiodiplodia mahajangana TaxID=1108764 RepID=A0ACC2J680_9PEZI|nr:hypothetical protein O1611_g9698 [Lasiodiplodia mahajangana]
MLAKLCTSATVAFAVLASAAPQGPIGEQAIFKWRFFDNYGCDHGSSPDDTWPPINYPPGSGDAGFCYTAPTRENWTRLETDTVLHGGGALGLQTFCDVNCGGKASAKQQGITCYLPADGCAIKSL